MCDLAFALFNGNRLFSQQHSTGLTLLLSYIFFLSFSIVCWFFLSCVCACLFISLFSIQFVHSSSCQFVCLFSSSVVLQSDFSKSLSVFFFLFLFVFLCIFFVHQLVSSEVSWFGSQLVCLKVHSVISLSVHSLLSSFICSVVPFFECLSVYICLSSLFSQSLVCPIGCQFIHSFCHSFLSFSFYFFFCFLVLSFKIVLLVLSKHLQLG